MSERIDGPLLRPSDRTPVIHEVAPRRQKCPDCGRRLTVTGVETLLGLQTLFVWDLACSNGHRFQYDNGWDHGEDAYRDDPDGLHFLRTSREEAAVERARRTP